MPPKKKKATKGKTKAPEPAAFTDRDALKRCEHDLALLQHENEVLRLELQSSKANERLREKNEEDENYHEISASMARQFKTMQHELQRKVSTLEETNTALTARIQEQEAAARRTKEERDRREQELVDECRELRRNMEVMSDDFAGMLRETLDKMSERMVSQRNFNIENT